MAEGTPSRPQRAEATISQAGGNWVLVPAAEDGEVLIVNDTGHTVFSGCDGSRTSADLAQLVAAGAPVSVADVRADVEMFLRRLVTAGLLRKS